MRQVCLIHTTMERYSSTFALLLLMVVYKWVQARIDAHILHQKNRTNPISSPWFSVTRATVMTHKYWFVPRYWYCIDWFVLYQQHKSSASKVKFRQASNCWVEWASGLRYCGRIRRFLGYTSLHALPWFGTQTCYNIPFVL